MRHRVAEGEHGRALGLDGLVAHREADVDDLAFGTLRHGHCAQRVLDAEVVPYFGGEEALGRHIFCDLFYFILFFCVRVYVLFRKGGGKEWGGGRRRETDLFYPTLAVCGCNVSPFGTGNATVAHHEQREHMCYQLACVMKQDWDLI